MLATEPLAENIPGKYLRSLKLGVRNQNDRGFLPEELIAACECKGRARHKLA